MVLVCICLQMLFRYALASFVLVCVCECVRRNVTTKIAVLLAFNSCARSSFNWVCLRLSLSLCVCLYLHTAFTTQSVDRYRMYGVCNSCVRFATDIYLFKIGSMIRIDIIYHTNCKKMETRLICAVIEKRKKNYHNTLITCYKLKQLLKIFVSFL